MENLFNFGPSVRVENVTRKLDTRKLVAQTLFGEANFDENEMRSMASVIFNRAKRENADINSILAAKDKYGRFEFQGLGNDQARKYLSGNLGGLNEQEKAKMAERIADELVGGSFRPINNARFFYHKKGKLNVEDREGSTPPGALENLNEFSTEERSLIPGLSMNPVNVKKESLGRRILSTLDKLNPFGFNRQVKDQGIGKDIAQGIARSGASVGLTLANKPELSFPDDPELDSVVKKIFGETPKSLATRVAESEIALPEGKALPFGIKAPKELALPGILALTALDFTGFGGESKALSALAKADKAEDIINILARMKVPAAEAEKLVEPLRLAKNADEVEAVLKGGAKAQVVDPLISEARKYKTAEEAVGSGKFLVRGVSGRTAKNPLGLEGGVWATDNFELARTFGDTLEVVPKPKKILQSDVFELADMVGKTEPGEMTAKNWEKIRTDLRSQGYDAVNLGQGHMDNANDFWLLDEKTQRIPTSLWEQAQKGASDLPGGVKATEAIQPQSPLLKAESAPLSDADQAGRAVPESIHGSVGSFDGTMPEHEASVNRLLTALKEAGPIRKAQEAGYSAERGKRIAAARAVREDVKGEAGLYAELSKLKGELPKETFESLRGKVSQTDIDNFFDMVTSSPKLGDFEKINARQGLAKMFGQLGGQVPTESELNLLSKVFPPDVIKELLDKRPFMAKFGDALVDILNIPRAIQSSFDLSAPFRQGVFMIGKPKQFFGAFKDMFKSFGSEKAYRALMDSIETRPSYQLMRDAKLAVTDLGQVTQREEQFLSNVAERIPLAGKLVRASGRAYTGFLSKVRADVFDDLVAKATALGRTPKTDPTLVEDIARFVNSATGRGSLGALERSARVMNAVFFSPRLMASRVNLLNPLYYMKLDPFVRKEALKTLLVDTSIAMTVLSLAKAGGASVGVDPRNADFGKIKIGNTRLDVMGGFQQYLRLGAQVATGKLVSSTTGKIMTLGEGYKPLTRLDIIERFFIGKENPIASFVTSALQGQDLIGTEFKVGPEIVKRFIPMIVQDAQEAIKEWGVGKGTILSLPSVFGVGVQTYKSPQKSKKSNPFNI